MTSLYVLLQLAVLAIAKIVDNALSTTRTILVQRNRCILAGVALAASNYVSTLVMRHVVNAEGQLEIIAVSIASGIGCCLAVAVSNKLSKDRTYVHVVLSDNRAAMQDFRDFLAQHHITNLATDSYTRDWEQKSIAVTVYADTKAKERIVLEYLQARTLIFKHVTP